MPRKIAVVVMSLAFILSTVAAVHAAYWRYGRGNFEAGGTHGGLTNDTDNDGMYDRWEDDNGLNKTANDAGDDPDNDGLTNLLEFDNDLNPQSGDTDSDGMPDKWEVDNGLMGYDGTDAGFDPDGDEVTNLQEYQRGTNPGAADFTNESLSAAANTPQNIDASGQADTRITLVTSALVTGAYLRISKFTSATAAGASSLSNSLGKYIKINASSNLIYNLTLATQLRIYYTGAEVTGAGLDESTLVMRKYTGGTWTTVSGSTVDTTNKYVWANVSSFSVYAISGTAPSPPPTGGGEAGGGGGGGGGAGVPPPPTFEEGVNLLTPQLMKKVVEDKELMPKPFYTGPLCLAPTLITAGDYPAPTFPLVRGLLSEPVTPVGEPARIVRGISVTSPRSIEEMYSISSERVLEKYIFASTVIVVRRDPPVDGIAAVAYARSMHAPILLTDTEKLPEATLNALKKLRPTKIVIVGGPVAVSTSVEKELGEIANVERIWGETRYETAIKMAEKFESPEAIVITDGINPSADALIISAEYEAPVIYTKGSELPRAAEVYLLKQKIRTAPRYGPMSWVISGVERGTSTEIEALYSLPEFLTKERLAARLYKLFTFSGES